MANWKTKKYQKNIRWNYKYFSLRKPKIKAILAHHDSKIHQEIIQNLKIKNFSVFDLEIDLIDYKKFIDKAEYSKFPAYYGGGKGKNFIEKSLELKFYS